MPSLSTIDKWILGLDSAIKAISDSPNKPATASPAKDFSEAELDPSEKRHAAGLMRVNHTGEVCAQALYQGQALTAKLVDVREKMAQAAAEETDHLAWCGERLAELDSRPSLLNPLFYGLSFTTGATAGLLGDSWSLGFVAATEEKVCEHLQHHLQELPSTDRKSQAIVQQMLSDEARHGQDALDAGGAELPTTIKNLMVLSSKLMTTTTYHI